MPNDWSREEVEATVADYLAMLSAELAGVPYNKAVHRRELVKLLDNRSEQAIEFKHANISAVLIDLGSLTLRATNHGRTISSYFTTWSPIALPRTQNC